ncbi:uncharacterized protein LOC113354296 [Papaver somniferum]|uniref:uncharacterized protein LOC113354296 n=1 Tax=Papaver somniferum TaxID=3469 RepID=UPI000E6F6999|nr:uncharacterized protein LOC113354296 [Papaver somniferum]
MGKGLTTNAMLVMQSLYGNDVIPGSYNGRSVNFFISDILKPSLAVSDTPSTSSDTQPASLFLELLNNALQSKFTTISSIPAPCRISFSRTLKSCLDAVILNPREISSWIKLLLLPICTLNLYIPKNSSEKRSGTRKRMQAASINQDLVDWREPNGCLNLINTLLERPKRCQLRKPKSKQAQASENLEACRKKLSYGHYTAAIKVLSSDGVTPCNEATLAELQHKHSTAHSPAILTESISCDAISVDTASVLKAIKGFPKGTSCGCDGLRDQHLLDAMSGAANAVADELVVSITKVVNMWLSGKCPSSLGEFISSSTLTPLQKPSGGIRQISIGTIWRRLVSKLANTKVGKDMSVYLGDCQFGVDVPCGERILHSVNRSLEIKGNRSDTSMLLIDFTNAFNMVDRTSLIKEVRSHFPAISQWVEFCFATPTRLYYKDTILSSAQGVQHGNPLGPLLFSLTLHPIVRNIASKCKLDLQAWYLDDRTIIGDTLEVYKDLQIILA